MTERQPPDVPEPDAGREDLGEPLQAVAALRYQVAPGFLQRVRRRIHRRVLGRHATEFAWSVPAVVLRSFLDLLIGVFARNRDEHGETTPWNR